MIFLMQMYGSMNKDTTEPPYEMVSMKLPAELFSRYEKNNQKRDGRSVFF
jgi:hypothetical protein